jgi:hypothetical protein
MDIERVPSPRTSAPAPLPRRRPGASDQWWSLAVRRSTAPPRSSEPFHWFGRGRAGSTAFAVTRAGDQLGQVARALPVCAAFGSPFQVVMGHGQVQPFDRVGGSVAAQAGAAR